MAVNSIGAYPFVSLTGRVVAPNEQIQRIVRAGIDGVGLKKTGRRGEPFVLRSMVDAVTLESAQTRLEIYRGMVGLAPVELVKNDFAYSTVGFLVAVLDVAAEPPRTVVTPCGGLLTAGAASAVKLVCQWRLQAVET